MPILNPFKLRSSIRKSKELGIHDKFLEIEGELKKDIKSVNDMIQIQEKKIHIISNIEEVWNAHYKRANNFVNKTLPALITKQQHYISELIKDCETRDSFFMFLERIVEQTPGKKVPEAWSSTISSNDYEYRKRVHNLLNTHETEIMKELHLFREELLVVLKKLQRLFLSELKILKSNKEWYIIHPYKNEFDSIQESEKGLLNEVSLELSKVDEHMYNVADRVRGLIKSMDYFKEKNDELKEFLKKQDYEGIDKKIKSELKKLIQKINSLNSLEEIKVYLAEEGLKRFNSPTRRYYLIAMMYVAYYLIEDQKSLLTRLKKSTFSDQEKELSTLLEMLEMQDYYLRTTINNLESGRFFFRYMLLKEFKGKYENIPRKYNFFMNLISLSNSIHDEFIKGYRDMRKKNITISSKKLGLSNLPYFSKNKLGRKYSNIKADVQRFLQIEPLYANFHELELKNSNNVPNTDELPKEALPRIRRVEEEIKRLFPENENILFHSTTFFRFKEVIQDNGISSKFEKIKLEKSEIEGQTAAGSIGISFNFNYPAHFGFGFDPSISKYKSTHWVTFIFPMRRVLKEGYLLSLAESGIDEYEILLRNPYLRYHPSDGQMSPYYPKVMKDEVIPAYIGYLKKMHAIYKNKRMLMEFENYFNSKEDKILLDLINPPSTHDYGLITSEKEEIYKKFKESKPRFFRIFKDHLSSFFDFISLNTVHIIEEKIILYKDHFGQEKITYSLYDFLKTFKDFVRSLGYDYPSSSYPEELFHYEFIFYLNLCIKKRYLIGIKPVMLLAINNSGIDPKKIKSMNLSEMIDFLNNNLLPAIKKVQDMHDSRDYFLETKVFINDCIAIISSSRFKEAERLFEIAGKRPRVVIYSDLILSNRSNDVNRFVKDFLEPFKKMFNIRPSLDFKSDAQYKQYMEGKCFVGTKYDFEGNCTEFKLVKESEVEKT